MGVRQGDNLSPSLFGLYINSLAVQINRLGKGVNIGQDKLSVLLYADDMVFLAEKEQDLQLMLDSMYIWANKWRMKVNAEKSKIVHFRPKRKPVTEFIFKYGNIKLERTTEYRYLGIHLDQHLDFKLCSHVLTDAGMKALGGVINKFQNMKDCGYNTFTKLFEAGVVSVVNYGASIWGGSKFPKCDTVMNRAIRYFLGVHRYAPIPGIQGEMGWLSLKYLRYIAMTRLWNRLLKMDDNRLTKKMFTWFFNHPSNTWFSEMQKPHSNISTPTPSPPPSCLYTIVLLSFYYTRTLLGVAH